MGGLVPAWLSVAAYLESSCHYHVFAYRSTHLHTNIVMEPLSISVSIIALVNSASTVVQYLYGIKNAGKERSRLAREIAGLLPLLTQLEDRLRDAQANDPWFQGCLSLAAKEGTIARLSQTLEEMKRKFEPETTLKKLSQKLAWPINEKEFERMLAQVERQKSQINIVLNQDHFQLSKAILEKSKETKNDVQAIQDAKDLDEIIAWLSPLKSMEQQKQIYGKAAPDTGNWFLESDKFQSWILGNFATLFCSGAHGTGKVCSMRGMGHYEDANRIV